MNIIKTPDFMLGCVEDRNDPLMLGRARVRILGLHTHDKSLLPTEDLPWAYKIQPTTSGAMTGIGHSPVGVMEGTWVAVQFIDPDKQIPFIVGTLGGIPQTKQPPLDSFELLNSESNVKETVTPDTTQAPEEPPKTQEEKLQATSDSLPVKSAREFTTSQEGLNLMHQFEGFKSAPYQDVKGVWTIGYGSTYLADGSPVTANTPSVTKEQADELMKYKLAKEFEPAVKKVRAPITQSMFDGMVCLCYNIGTGAFSKSSVKSKTDTADYNGAAEAFLMWNKSGGVVYAGLTRRREAEKALYLSDGIPKTDGSIAETPQSMAADEKAIQEAPSGVAESSPAAASAAQYQRRKFNGQLGFKDPNGKYPLQTHLNEPDTNRLARHQKIKDTIVYFKECAEHKGVEIANGGGTWDQAKTPYNASYPFNNVFQSESGHVQEWDDTPGKERIHTYHKTGTFWEVDHNGTLVRRTVGDDYQILERNGYVHVIGNAHVCVEGAKTLLVNNTLDIEVMGTTVINVHDSATIATADDLNLSVGGNINLDCSGDLRFKVGGDANFDVGGNWVGVMGGNFGVKAVNVDEEATGVWNVTSSAPAGFLTSGVKIANRINSQGSGAQVGSPSTTSLDKVDGVGGEAVELEQLMVTSRGDDAASNYESPDDGDPTVYMQERIANGTATVEELTTKPEAIAEEKPLENEIAPVIGPCGIAEGTTTFDYNAKFSKYYTLGDLTDGGTRKLVAQNGLRADQIYCNLKALANNILDPIKAKYADVQINSGLRLGTATSQHNKGQAVDISFPGMSRSDLYTRILEIQKIVPYDQLLLEYASGPGWIHISFNSAGNRKPSQQFTMNNHSRVSPDVYTIVKIY